MALDGDPLTGQALGEGTGVVMCGQAHTHFPLGEAGPLGFFGLLPLQTLVLDGMLGLCAWQWQRGVLPPILLGMPAPRADLPRDLLLGEYLLHGCTGAGRFRFGVGVQKNMPLLVTYGDVLGSGQTGRTVALVGLQGTQQFTRLLARNLYANTKIVVHCSALSRLDHDGTDASEQGWAGDLRRLLAQRALTWLLSHRFGDERRGRAFLDRIPRHDALLDIPAGRQLELDLEQDLLDDRA